MTTRYKHLNPECRRIIDILAQEGFIENYLNDRGEVALQKGATEIRLTDLSIYNSGKRVKI